MFDVTTRLADSENGSLLRSIERQTSSRITCVSPRKCLPTQLANDLANVSKTCQIMGIEDGGQPVPSYFTPTETAKLDSFGVKF